MADHWSQFLATAIEYDHKINRDYHAAVLLARQGYEAAEYRLRSQLEEERRGLRHTHGRRAHRGEVLLHYEVSDETGKAWAHSVSINVEGVVYAGERRRQLVERFMARAARDILSMIPTMDSREQEEWPGLTSSPTDTRG